jgi:predicted membrane channel-forming protein YqfA (hemolysin III family)
MLLQSIVFLVAINMSLADDYVQMKRPARIFFHVYVILALTFTVTSTFYHIAEHRGRSTILLIGMLSVLFMITFYIFSYFTEDIQRYSSAFVGISLITNFFIFVAISRMIRSE